MSAQAGVSGVDEKICMAIADARVAHLKALQAELINHAAGGSARRIFENAAGAFLIERLTGAAFFVADANPLENFSGKAWRVIPVSPRA
jgi:uncharacterized MAPEG superfamily protein